VSPTARRIGTTFLKVRITHLFHPLYGRTFELICRRRCWGEDRVVYAVQDGRLRTIASAFTDVDPADEFRLVAAGSAAFHTVDLLALCETLDRLAESMRVGDA